MKAWEMTAREYAQQPNATFLPENLYLSTPMREWTVQWLSRFNLHSLQALCMVNGIAMSGTKEDVISRLMLCKEMTDCLDNQTPESLVETHKLDQLKEMCRQLKLSVSPTNKKTLSIRLLNWLIERRATGRKNIATTKHQIFVEKAWNKGEPVPERVLAEYPYLRKMEQKQPTQGFLVLS